MIFNCIWNSSWYTLHFLLSLLQFCQTTTWMKTLQYGPWTTHRQQEIKMKLERRGKEWLCWFTTWSIAIWFQSKSSPSSFLLVCVHLLCVEYYFCWKIITFLFFNCIGIGSLFSFITIHMKSLGMTVEETGIINGVSSTTAIFAPFLLGLIADKIGNFKVSHLDHH